MTAAGVRGACQPMKRQASSTPCTSRKRRRQASGDETVHLSREFVHELDDWCDGDSKQLSSEFVAAASRETQRLMTATEVVVVYRGLALPKTHSLMQHDVGARIRLSQTGGPSSWSTKPRVARTFAGVYDLREQVQYDGLVVRASLNRDQIILNTKRLPASLRRFKDECEVIAQPGEFDCVVHAIRRRH